MRKRNPKAAVDAFIGQQPRDARARELKARKIEAWYCGDTGGDIKVPCLRCARRVATKRVDRGAGESFYYLRCKSCGPVSPNFGSREDAVAYWNGQGGAA